ncbi:MAG: hypothetical protein JO016_18045 [Actinobacteria bacterium]|nr:hypothetical protein [Actinomycetota bacterium]
MIGKLLKFAAPAAIGALAALSFPDAKRYVAIRRISSGHPEVVPAEGARAYAQDAAHAAPDGTGDFDSARRGGGPVRGEPAALPGEARRSLAA